MTEFERFARGLLTAMTNNWNTMTLWKKKNIGSPHCSRGPFLSPCGVQRAFGPYKIVISFTFTSYNVPRVSVAFDTDVGKLLRRYSTHYPSVVYVFGRRVRGLLAGGDRGGGPGENEKRKRPGGKNTVFMEHYILNNVLGMSLYNNIPASDGAPRSSRYDKRFCHTRTRGRDPPALGRGSSSSVFLVNVISVARVFPLTIEAAFENDHD